LSNFNSENEFEKLKKIYEKIIIQEPNNDKKLNEYAILLQKNGFIKEAIDNVVKAIRISPKNEEYLSNLAFFNFVSGDFLSALDNYYEVSNLNPENGEILNNIGITLNRLRRFTEAIIYFNKAIKINSKNFSYYYNKANSYLFLRDYENAIQFYSKSLLIKPDHLKSLHNRAYAKEELLLLDDALEDYEKCIKLQPSSWMSYLSKSHIHLINGDFKNGWRLREYRWKIDKFNQIHKILDPKKLWLGDQSIQDKKILIPFEQGLGDTIQFCRLAKNLKKLNAKVKLIVQKPLVELIKTLDENISVISTEEKNIQYDFYCPLLSLPFALKINDNIPNQVPYLQAKKEKIFQWRRKLEKNNKLKIGIAWKGNPLNSDDFKRSYQLKDVIDIFDSRYEWISLHHEISSEEEEIINNSNIINLAYSQKNFDDLVAICECLDLIITVDTSIVHLAGALGKNTFLLLAYNPDFRWLKEIDNSPWYPTIKIFRHGRNTSWRYLVKKSVESIKINSD